MDHRLCLQGWVLSKMGWQAPPSPPANSVSTVERHDSGTAAGTVDLSDTAPANGAAKRKGPAPGDAVQDQESGVVVDAAGAGEKEAVLELRYHGGLFTQAFFKTGKDECPEESRLQLDSAAIDEVRLRMQIRSWCLFFRTRLGSMSYARCTECVSYGSEDSRFLVSGYER